MDNTVSPIQLTCSVVTYIYIIFVLPRVIWTMNQVADVKRYKLDKHSTYVARIPSIQEVRIIYSFLN